MSALQVLRQPRHRGDNVQLTTAILGHIQGLAAQGRCVRFNWVPSHIGVRGNEAADEAAREATRHPAVALTVLPSIQGPRYWPDALPSVPQNNSIASWCRHRGRQPGTNKPRKTTSRYAPPSSCPEPRRSFYTDFGLAT
ncbi:hypothetical protein GWK47_034276 [Chionoecetes opilio]|uniref:RNase H type-1 domain-containing protein n=1 Tax=Chionoecetes opilio TaxID=41210 RepID=A0A8J4YRE4_CHIOP|nr:hypothetical protein GWK47_034276 [Chionoecetes opilio]